jgi:hypothetical protein
MIQEFLPYISMGLQWARAQQKFSELWFAAIVVGRSAILYAMATPNPFANHFFGDGGILVGWWDQAKTILASVQGISTLSNVAVSLKLGKASNPILPVTDSKA